ncbi:hypothetical protein JNM87_06405 [Candidatus Saccharibacteria bacterium]|nr:hypothetical protein [Candidatus Saccharibacteria bacterium]
MLASEVETTLYAQIIVAEDDLEPPNMPDGPDPNEPPEPPMRPEEPDIN